METKREKRPLVSVLITIYNAEEFVGQALQSIINQTYHNLEIIVVNDGSTDQTAKILEQFAKQDKRVKIFSLEKNTGPSLASNFGLKKARGKYIARMDADDIAFPDRIEKQVKFLNQNPQVVMLGGQCKLIDEEGRYLGEKVFPITHRGIYDSLFTINPIQHPTCMINRQLLPKNLVWYENHSVLAHDLELVFKMAQYGNLANLSEFVLFYRQCQNSLSLKNPKKTFRATLEVRKKALTEYAYQPSFLGIAANFIQTVFVLFLPNKFIYPAFALIRGLRKVDLSGVAALVRKEKAAFSFRQ